VEPERKKLLEKTSARAVLRKPVSREELAHAIAQHLAAARQA
jgi:CheY-like chemotaxis protein